jgi:hypothetical protein
VSQIRAAALPVGTEQFALVASLRQRPNTTRAARLGMSPVLLEHKRKLLSNEL